MLFGSYIQQLWLIIAIVTHWRHSRRLKFERKNAIVFAFASALASTASLVFFDFRDNLGNIKILTFLGCSKKVQKRNLPDFLSLQNPLLVVQFRNFLFLLLLGPKSWSLFYDRIGLKTKFSVSASLTSMDKMVEAYIDSPADNLLILYIWFHFLLILFSQRNRLSIVNCHARTDIKNNFRFRISWIEGDSGKKINLL